MSELFDELAREIAKGTSRRAALKNALWAWLGIMFPFANFRLAKAASITPVCGTCQACDIATNTCGLPCSPPSAGQALCATAGRNGSYLRLAYYLNTNGFTATGASNVIQLLQNATAIGSAISTSFTGTSTAGQTATIEYVVTPQGDVSVSAYVFSSGVAIYALSVDPSGRIVKTIATQTHTTQSAAQNESPQTSAKSLLEPQVTQDPGHCGTLVDYVCGTGGGLACFGAGLLFCAETGPAAIPCGLLVTVVCGGIAIFGCDAVKQKFCQCPANQQTCSEICCDPCMDCLNGKCIPNITCGNDSVCCNNVCCASGLVCSNNVCTSPNAACVGATCNTFVPCSSNSDCVCVTIAEGGGLCVPGSTACAGLAICDSAPCPAGSLCAIGTCCGDSVCVPISLQCSPLTNSSAAVRSLSMSTGPTIGHL